MKMFYDYMGAAEEQRLIVVLEGGRVRFDWRGQVVDMRVSKGVRYLVELLLHPYMGISATALHSLVNHEPARYPFYPGQAEDGVPAGDSFQSILPQPLCDPATVSQVRQKLNLLTVLIAEAEEWNDLARLEEMKLERDALLDYLKESLSLRQSRLAAGDQDYRCADSVYHAITHTLGNLEKQCPALGALLRRSLHLWGDLLFIPADNLSVLVMEEKGHCVPIKN